MHIMYFGHFLSHRISLFCPVLPLTASFFQIVGVSFLGMQLSTPHRQLHTASLLPTNPPTLILVLPSFPHQEPTTSTAVVSTPLLKCIPPSTSLFPHWLLISSSILQTVTFQLLHHLSQCQCLSYFSIDVQRHRDQGNLQKKTIILGLTVPEDIESMIMIGTEQKQACKRKAKQQQRAYMLRQQRRGRRALTGNSVGC